MRHLRRTGNRVQATGNRQLAIREGPAAGDASGYRARNRQRSGSAADNVGWRSSTEGYDEPLSPVACCQLPVPGCLFSGERDAGPR
jgi:hypothetical protein